MLRPSKIRDGIGLLRYYEIKPYEYESLEQRAARMRQRPEAQRYLRRIAAAKASWQKPERIEAQRRQGAPVKARVQRKRRAAA